ncbi:MAG: hypothetical protein WC718_15950 [Phycisphaerales bacterium]|jgi:hypothetical protein
MAERDAEAMIAAARSGVESAHMPIPAALANRVRVRRRSRLAQQSGAVLIAASVLLVGAAWMWPTPHEINPRHPGLPLETNIATHSDEPMTLLAIRLGGDRVDQATKLNVLPGGKSAIVTPIFWGQVPQ